ncbi:hypothetical protein [Agriterribacter sp.]|uniref:hypothetical protein n=1 Tax=Agriterribacter sp. TaxID=2821509 RepID=UPI002C108543|nr:hypothetical protein [Agriterribacter sp.]HRO44407.1 hypothetical protein [Agriterribacter sp.]HRQ18973.1 hypothetical protein [Agriterribacter sp.]
MADIKRRTLTLISGKQIKLYGNSMAIGSSLEVGEGAAPNILSFMEQSEDEKPDGTMSDFTAEIKPKKAKSVSKPVATVLNPHRLTVMEILEMADFNIQLWMQLKDNIRRYGLDNPKIFNREM